MDNTVKSPTQTATWLRCPIKRALAYSYGFKPRRLMHSEIAAIGGKAFGKAMEFYNKGTELEEILAMTEAEIESQKDSIKGEGREVPDWEQAYFASVTPRTLNAVTKYVANDPLKGWKIEDVELTLPDHGNARIDLGARDDFGLSVIDYKFKLRLDAKYYDKTVDGYRNNWQQFHYCWAYGEYKGEPIQNYYICLVVSEPKFSVKLHEFPVHPESMKVWLESAQRIWGIMSQEDAGVAIPWQAAEHEDKWGPCEYQKLCFDHRFDSNLAVNSGDYVIAKEVI